MDLRTLVELEGGGKPLAELIGQPGVTDFRLLVLLAVREIYRPARAKMRSDNPDVQGVGRDEMREFANVCRVVSGRAREKHDLALALLALHNAASAYGVLGETTVQNMFNVQVVREIEAVAGWEKDPDLRFVHTKAFFGRVENDTEHVITTQEWWQAVARLSEDRYPDYPGRALRLARYLDEIGQVQEAGILLARARAADFGKPDQLADVEAYLVSRSA
jgi:hypothetical protein